MKKLLLIPAVLMFGTSAMAQDVVRRELVPRHEARGRGRRHGATVVERGGPHPVGHGRHCGEVDRRRHALGRERDDAGEGDHRPEAGAHQGDPGALAAQLPGRRARVEDEPGVGEVGGAHELREPRRCAIRGDQPDAAVGDRAISNCGTTGSGVVR